MQTVVATPFWKNHLFRQERTGWCLTLAPIIGTSILKHFIQKFRAFLKFFSPKLITTYPSSSVPLVTQPTGGVNATQSSNDLTRRVISRTVTSCGYSKSLRRIRGVNP